jgi:hypothetical protein
MGISGAGEGSETDVLGLVRVREPGVEAYTVGGSAQLTFEISCCGWGWS